MLKLFHKASKKAGLPPGTLVHTGEQKVENVRISITDFDRDSLETKEGATIEDCLACRDKPTVSWLNVSGIHDVDLIASLGKAFGLHPLLLEDVVHTGQRPKTEDFGDYILIIMKMLTFDDSKNEILSEQVSLVLGPNYVISFQEHEGDVFTAVRHRIANGKGRIRKMGADYLAYALADAVVDHYFSILEKYGERIEALQEDVLGDTGPGLLQTIKNAKTDMIFLRKSVWPMREAISTLARSESDLIHEKLSVYLRDLYDHTIQVVESIELLRDLISGTLDIYLSSASNRMNEIMKVLTMMASIFIPLTFIAGIYGMNFKHMPELELYWAYPVVWLVILLLALLMLIFFKRKRWF